MHKEKKSLAMRALNSVCALTFLVTLIYVLVGGVEKYAFGLMLASIVGVGLPVVMEETVSFLEIVVGILEALLEGIVAILEFISRLVSGLFG